MYEKFYGLSDKPFSIRPDPEFLFPSRRHSMAYAMLEYGIQNGADFSVLCGGVGCGKSTLLRHLINNLNASFTIGLINNTHPHIADFMSWIMHAFGLPFDNLSQIAMYEAFQHFLIENYEAGQRTILIVDEAQNLSRDALEFLRMLSNMNANKAQLLQMILVGQPQLLELLHQSDMEQLLQRVAVEFYLTPLDKAEVEAYINFRLQVVGRVEPLFTQEACERIATHTKGIPRVINVLCDNALTYGFSADTPLINLDLVNEVLRDWAEFGCAPRIVAGSGHVA